MQKPAEVTFLGEQGKNQVLKLRAEHYGSPARRCDQYRFYTHDGQLALGWDDHGVLCLTDSYLGQTFFQRRDGTLLAQKVRDGFILFGQVKRTPRGVFYVDLDDFVLDARKLGDSFLSARLGQAHEF